MNNLLTNENLFVGVADLLTISELQKVLKTGRTTTYQIIKDKEIKHVKIGKSIKIPKIYVIEYLNNLIEDKQDDNN